MIDLTEVQDKLWSWQITQFPEEVIKILRLELALGMNEEAGEVAHAILKRSQNIREGTDINKIEELVADGVSDALIYGMNLCSTFNINFEEVFVKTVESVLKRNWKENPENGEVLHD